MMSQYEMALIALLRLLEKVQDKNWTEWIREDLELWKTERLTKHHLRAYGTIGSITDFRILKVNGYKIKEDKEPWANELLLWLLALCRKFVEDPEREWSMEEIRGSTGRFGSVIPAFAGEMEESELLSSLSGDNTSLSGWRCKECGYSEVTTEDVESLVAERIVPPLVFSSIEKRKLEKILVRVIAGRVRGATQLRRKVIRLLPESDIQLVDRDGSMRPCPSCDSNHTVVYRWIDREKHPPAIVPSSLNLPMDF